MRRVYRAFGGLRLVAGAMLFVTGYSNQAYLGVGPSIFLMLTGTVVALSGAINVFLVLLGSGLYAILLFAFGWVLSAGWQDGSLISYINDRLDHIGAYIGLALLTFPLIFWNHNKSWWLMADKFTLNEPPLDTKNINAFDWGIVELCGDHFAAAVTLTEQGIILDRRNFAAVILPWRWIRKIKPILEPNQVAELSLANDNGDLLLVDVPWSPEFFQLVPDGVTVSAS